MKSTGSSPALGTVHERVLPDLRRAGFVKQRNDFVRSLPDVVQLITFQKSSKTTRGHVVFAVNLGVASRRLLSLDGKEPAKARLEDCHWRKRVKNEDTGDSWWTVVDDTSAAQAGDQVARSLESNDLPALDQLSRDSALCALWLSGKSPGLTDMWRLVNLVALLRTLGPAEDLKRALDEIEEMAKSCSHPILVAALREAGAS